MKVVLIALGAMVLTSQFASAAQWTKIPTDQIPLYAKAVTAAMTDPKSCSGTLDNGAPLERYREQQLKDLMQRIMSIAQFADIDNSGSQPLLRFAYVDKSSIREGSTWIQVTTSTDEKSIVSMTRSVDTLTIATTNVNVGNIGHPNFQDQTTTTKKSVSQTCTF